MRLSLDGKEYIVVLLYVQMIVRTFDVEDANLFILFFERGNIHFFSDSEKLFFPLVMRLNLKEKVIFMILFVHIF